MKVPKISVIVPVYNCEKYIGRCIRSLLAQSYLREDFEIIVINDGSSDKTSFALELFKEEIVLIDHTEQRGLPSALNSGIKRARGQYIIRLDSDDYVHAQYLNFLSIYLDMNHDYEAAACDYLEVDDYENVIRRVNCEEEPIGCGIMFRVAPLIDVGLYDEDMLFHEEKDLKKRFEEKYKIKRVDLPLYRYRKHDNNMTNDTETSGHYLKKLSGKHSYDFISQKELI